MRPSSAGARNLPTAVKQISREERSSSLIPAQAGLIPACGVPAVDLRLSFSIRATACIKYKSRDGIPIALTAAIQKTAFQEGEQENFSILGIFRILVRILTNRQAWSVNFPNGAAGRVHVAARLDI